MPIWRHQEDAIAWAWSRPWAIWHHGMGSGKTRTTLEFIKRWLAEHGGSRILVCCPKAVIAAWVKQVGLWAPHIRVVALDKASSAAKEKAFQAAIADTSPASGVASRWAGKMTKSNPQAKRLGLSGTLIPHSILDAWAIYRSVESPDCTTFGTSYTIHKANYAVMPPG
ncbi:MAG: hypothetical protein EBR82_82465, partial [Caulobacteraceae bacterium]|nr:hypothetical protein [Caulobacteraceae bacterium]